MRARSDLLLLLSSLALAGCGTSDAHPALGECEMRCETRGVVCGFPDVAALNLCNGLCAASPTEDQLTCLQAIPCAQLTSSPPPCGIVLLDAGVGDGAGDDAMSSASDGGAIDLAHGSDLACSAFGQDPPCSPIYCETAFPNGPYRDARCNSPGASCFYWCGASGGWEVTCGGDGRTECTDSRCEANADLLMAGCGLGP